MIDTALINRLLLNLRGYRQDLREFESVKLDSLNPVAGSIRRILCRCHLNDPLLNTIRKRVTVHGFQNHSGISFPFEIFSNSTERVTRRQHLSRKKCCEKFCEGPWGR